MKKSPKNPFTGSSVPAFLVTLCLAGSPAFAADYFHLGGADVRIDQAAYYSNTNGIATAATVAPGVALGSLSSDNLFFYNSLVAAPLNKTFELGSTGRTYNSLTFGSNAGTTQINRAATGSTTTHLLGIGAGGITVESGAGPVTFGSGSGATGQRVAVGAYADYTVANNSSSALTFFREFDGRGAAPFTVTVAGSGDGDTIFKDIRRYDAARDLAMTINKPDGTGVVRFDGPNTYTGATTITAGTLSVGVTANLGAAAANLVFNGGTLQITGTTLSNFSGIGHAVSFTAAKAVGLDINNAGHTFTVDQVLDQTTGGFNKLGAGTAILNLTNTYTGLTTISAGILSVATIGNGGVAGNLGQATNAAANLVLGGGTLQYTGATASTDRAFTLSAGATSSIDVSTAGTTLTMSGASATTTGALTKTGLGTLSLTGANTYTGATTVAAGKLKVNGSTSASSAVSVSSGGTLGGGGTVGENTTVASGGTLAPGNSPGVLTVSGNTSFSSGSIFEWEIDTAQTNPETNRGTAYDGVNTTSVIGSGAIFKIMLTGTQDFADTFWNQTRTWTDIFKSADGGSNLSNWAAVFGGGFQYSYNGQAVAPTSQGYFTTTGNSLTWSAVPEPSNLLAGMFAASALLRRRRRS